MEGRVGLVGCDAAHSLPTKFTTRQPKIRHRSGKVCQPKTDVLTTEPVVWYYEYAWFWTLGGLKQVYTLPSLLLSVQMQICQV